MRYRAIVVDDEELAVKRLVRLLAEIGNVDVIETAMSGPEAVRKIDAENPDIVLLDIQMPGMTGFDVLRRIKRQPLIIFATAYDEYALRAFEENSIDYLLKPIERDRLAAAMQKIDRLRSGSGDSRPGQLLAIEEMLKRIESRQQHRRTNISVRVGNKTLVLDIASISAFVSEDRLVFAWVDEKAYAVDLTLDEIESRLAACRFLRIHRSAIVNLDFVGEIHSWFGGKLRIRLKRGNRELTVSRARAQTLRDALSL
ncbi:MAG: LytTR family DNA-binding domain-containing protein [Acidobacteriota bacterium]